ESAPTGQMSRKGGPGRSRALPGISSREESSSGVYGSTTIVQVYVSGGRLVSVSEVSHPWVGVESFDPMSVLLESTQLMVALVSPDPLSLKLTWMSESGALVKVAVA